MPRGRPRLLPDQVQHGTYAGYSYHRVHGTVPCAPCCRARADYEAARRRRARQSPTPTPSPLAGPTRTEKRDGN